jgi:hypothetical protein
VWAALVALSILAAIAAGAFRPAAAVTRTPYGQILWWTEDGVAATVLGANRSIVISTGRMHYETFCSNGKQDFM